MASEKVYERFQRPIASAGAWKLSIGRTLARRVRLTRNALTVQTMTTTAASDVEETLEQLVLFRKAGADIIRVTVPTLQDAKALQEVMRKFVGVVSRVFREAMLRAQLWQTSILLRKSL